MALVKNERSEKNKPELSQVDLYNYKIINIDLPSWAIQALDQEATRRGVARRALIKMWLVDRLDADQKARLP